MHQCPCGSQTTYNQCCGLYIDTRQSPQTPEQLMRSRYSAYSQANIDYIINTMKGKPLIHFKSEEAKDWAKSITWLHLKIVQSYQESPEKGFVEFIATFIERNSLKTMHELSEFHKEDNLWFYIDGINKELTNKKHHHKIARNSLCPCGNGKKFKNCHEK